MTSKIKTTGDVKKYIKNKYPVLNEKKFDVAKIGHRTYIYYIDHENNLQRSAIFVGSIPTVNELSVLKKLLDDNIHAVIKKWGYE